MDLNTLIALALFVIVASVTPGPNNILLMATASTAGFRGTLPLLAGIVVGFLCVVVVTGLGVGAMLMAFPEVRIGLKLLGLGYMLWLAVVLWRSARHGPGEAKKVAPGFLVGVLLQAVNPKGITMAIGANSAFASPEAPVLSVAIIAGTFFTLGPACMLLWVYMGAFANQRLSERGSMIFTRSMSVLTVVAGILMVV